jgi:hypothetical protein
LKIIYIEGVFEDRRSSARAKLKSVAEAVLAILWPRICLWQTAEEESGIREHIFIDSLEILTKDRLPKNALPYPDTGIIGSQTGSD